MEIQLKKSKPYFFFFFLFFCLSGILKDKSAYKSVRDDRSKQLEAVHEYDSFKRRTRLLTTKETFRLCYVLLWHRVLWLVFGEVDHPKENWGNQRKNGVLLYMRQRVGYEHWSRWQHDLELKEMERL